MKPKPITPQWSTKNESGIIPIDHQNNTMENKTLLVIAPGKNTPHGDRVYNILVAETGEHLASHFCSGSGWAYDDLYGGREERKEEWTKRFGELEVKYIDETSLTEEELVERNTKWYEEINKKNQKHDTLRTKK